LVVLVEQMLDVIAVAAQAEEASGSQVQVVAIQIILQE
jgi:hypothetical protein